MSHREAPTENPYAEGGFYLKFAQILSDRGVLPWADREGNFIQPIALIDRFKGRKVRLSLNDGTGLFLAMALDSIGDGLASLDTQTESRPKTVKE